MWWLRRRSRVGGLGQVYQLSIHARAHEPFAEGALEQVAELSLPSPDEGGANLDAGAGGPAEDLPGDLRRRLGAHGAAARGTVGGAGARPQEAQIVVDLGDGAHGGARVAAGGALLDGDRGGQSLDHIHIGLLHDAEELPGVGGEGLDVAALPLRVDGVEGERRLPGPGQPGDDDEPVARQFDVDVAEVVLPSPRTMSDLASRAGTGVGVFHSRGS